MGATKKNLDFTNVKEGGNFSKKRMPVGDYLGKIVKVEDSMPKDEEDRTPMWLFTLQLAKTPSATYPYYCKLQDNQLWKVRNLLVAAGLNVPKKKVGVDPNRLVNKLVGVSLDDAEYNGKEQSEIGAIFSPSELDATVSDEDDDVDDEEEEDEEVTVAPAKKKKKAAPVEEEEEEEDEEEEGDEFDEMDRTALKRALKKVNAEIRVTKSMTDDDLRELLRTASEDDDEDEEEEEAEPEPPKKKKKKKAKLAEDEDEIDIEDL